MLYRFRTSALVGPWRGSADEAVEDAVRARQARWEAQGDSLCWLVSGEIEEKDRPAARQAA